MPQTPMPDALAIQQFDATHLMGQTIRHPLSTGGVGGVCVVAVYGASGTYNVGLTPPPPVNAVGVPPPPINDIVYTLNPANTRPFPFRYNNGVTLASPPIQSSNLTGRHMEISYGAHQIVSWNNEPPTGPFATQPLPTAKTDVMFTVRDNFANGKNVFYVDYVSVNANAGNRLVVAMKPKTIFCDTMATSPFFQGEVHIAHQKFGTPVSPYLPVPSSLVTIDPYSGVLSASIPLPQATMGPFNNATGRPAPGIYYIRLRLNSGSLNMVAEISPAFVVWGL
jgi:hypothetical protein